MVVGAGDENFQLIAWMGFLLPTNALKPTELCVGFKWVNVCSVNYILKSYYSAKGMVRGQCPGKLSLCYKLVWGCSGLDS